MTIQSTGLSNEIIGGPSAIKGGIRFQAQFSSPFSSFRCYDIDHAPGYSGGTGGHIAVQLFADVNGLPGGPVLSNGVKVSDPQFPDPATGRGRFPLICFDKQIPLVKDNWYWLVISDQDPTPVTNYYSMDYLTNATVKNQVPTVSIWIWASGVWKLVDYLIPSPLEFYCSNGFRWGLGWIAAPGGVLACGQMYGFHPDSCK